jgi:hypothetical protein
VSGPVPFLGGLALMIMGMVLLATVVLQETTRTAALHWYSRTGIIAPLAFLLLTAGAVLAARD